MSEEKKLTHAASAPSVVRPTRAPDAGGGGEEPRELPETVAMMIRGRAWDALRSWLAGALRTAEVERENRAKETDRCAELEGRLAAAETERDAASLGLREALAAIEKAATILDGEARWSSLARADLVLLLGRGMTFLDNAPEMIRACVTGSIPRSDSSQTASETLVGEGRDGDGHPRDGSNG